MNNIILINLDVLCPSIKQMIDDEMGSQGIVTKQSWQLIQIKSNITKKKHEPHNFGSCGCHSTIFRLCT